jgi:hypothetical protein
MKMNHNRMRNAIGKYVEGPGHSINWRKSECLACEKGNIQKRIIESFLYKKLVTSL